MAPTVFIKSFIEPAMRQALAELCGGIDFRQRKMPIRWNAEGTGSFEFDAVSADGRVIACLSTARNLNAGQRHKLVRDATFMWLVPDVQRRILAVVEPVVAGALAAELRRGRLPPNTEIFAIKLNPEIREELERFREKAVIEVGGNWPPQALMRESMALHVNKVSVDRFKAFDGRPANLMIEPSRTAAWVERPQSLPRAAEDSPTLDPKAVCERAENESYMFYQHLSWDAHPSIESLNRYYEQPDANGAPGIDVSPVVRDAEVIEMLNLMCLAVIGVFLGVGDLLGQDNVPTGKMAAEYKALTERQGRRATNGYDFAGRFPLAAAAVAALSARSCLIDGEAIVTDQKGLAVLRQPSAAAVLCAFDLLELDGEDLRREPIETRKSTLKSLLRGKHAGIAFNAHFIADGAIVYRQACALGCEGIVSKRLGSPYRSGRADCRIKVKNPAAPAVTREAEKEWH